MDIRVRGDDGADKPWDGSSVGELQLRGPFITGSYHNVPQAPDRFTADGWLRTGDVASIDAHGYIRITDRTKDLIKSGGEWISSVDMENLLMAHPAVLEAAVIAIPDPKWTRTAARLRGLQAGQERDAGRTARAPVAGTSSSGSCRTASSSSMRFRALRPASSGR